MQIFVLIGDGLHVTAPDITPVNDAQREDFVLTSQLDKSIQLLSGAEQIEMEAGNWHRHQAVSILHYPLEIGGEQHGNALLAQSGGPLLYGSNPGLRQEQAQCRLFELNLADTQILEARNDFLIGSQQIR